MADKVHVQPLTEEQVAKIIAQLAKRKPHVLSEVERLTYTVEALGLSVEDLKKLSKKEPPI